MGLPASASENLITVNDYLEIEEKSPEKHEYFDGYLILMAGAGIKHNRIQKNLITLLENGFRKANKKCEAFGSDVRIKTSETKYFYPDISVFCSEPQIDEYHSASNPSVIVEILSKSSEVFDRGEKFTAYRKIPSLKQIILINPEILTMEIYTMQKQSWRLSETEGIKGDVFISEISCLLSDIFYNI